MGFLANASLRSGYQGLLVKTNGNVLRMEIVSDQSGYTLRVTQSRVSNEKLVQTLLERHSIWSLKGSLSSYFLDFSNNGHHSSITVTRLLIVVNMSLTEINSSLQKNNLHQQCKLFSKGNSLTQQWEHFFTSSGKIHYGSKIEHFIPNNDCKKSNDDSDGYYWKHSLGLLVKTNGNVLRMEIVSDQSGYTLRVTQSRVSNEKLVQTLLERHSIWSLKGSLSRYCDVEKND
nr:zinc finger, CCHC-type [Tanacetum cinerariifolium]